MHLAVSARAPRLSPHVIYLFFPSQLSYRPLKIPPPNHNLERPHSVETHQPRSSVMESPKIVLYPCCTEGNRSLNTIKRWHTLCCCTPETSGGDERRAKNHTLYINVCKHELAILGRKDGGDSTQKIIVYKALKLWRHTNHSQPPNIFKQREVSSPDAVDTPYSSHHHRLFPSILTTVFQTRDRNEQLN